MGKAIFDKGIKITNGQDVTTTPTFLTATSTNGTIEKTEPLQFAGNSAGAISGFEITNNGNGTVNIATGIAILRSANNFTSPLVKYTIPAQTNISLTDNANNFLLVNYNGGTPNILVTNNPTDINTTTNSIIYVISRVGNTLDYIALIGQNIDANAKLRRRFLNSEGLTRSQGAVLTSSNRNLLVTAGLFYSGLIEVTTPAFNTSGADTFTQAYINGSWVRTTGLSQINNTQYNLAGTLTTLPNNSYRVDYVYLLADNPSKLYVILGDAHYNNLADARLAPIPASLPTELQYLGARIGRVIIQKNASTMEVSSEFATIYASGSATLHNDLGGLNVGDYQHLTVAEKASIVTSSGTTNRIPKFNSSNTLGDSVLIQVGGNLGMGSAVVPGELFHIGDGNILLEGGGEVAQKFKRDFSTTGENLGVPTGSGVSVNPIFQIGRIIQAGDGDPEIRIMYSDDNTTERTVFEVDRKGIAASVKTSIGSHFEGFASLTDVNPKFRLNSYPRMRLEMGAGGNGITDVAVERGAGGELAFFTDSTKRGEFTFTGNFTTILDAIINGIKIGKGNNNLSNNTVLGLATGSAISTGNKNTFLGYAAGNANTNGESNTFIGNESGLMNIGGSSNTFIGGAAGFTNSSGANNSFVGGGAGYANTTGGANTFIGTGAGWYLADGTTGNVNSNSSVFIGNNTKALNASDTNEIIIGQGTTGLGSNTTIIGNNSTVFSAIKGRNLVGTTTDNGVDALQVTGSVGLNTAPTTSAGGYDILTRNTSTGKVEKVASSGLTIGSLEFNDTDKTVWNNGKNNIDSNVSFGKSSFSNNSSGTFNSIFGDFSMQTASNANDNVSLGYGSMQNATSASQNTSVGKNSLLNNISGGYNVSLGLSAGRFYTGAVSLTNSNNSVFIGAETRAAADSQTNQIVIGYNTDGNGSNTVTLGNNSIVSTYLKGKVITNNVVRLAQYTVSTLPTGAQGDTAYVTDALAPTYMATVVGGGAVVTAVFHNGTNWVAH
jgi:hypothetical protein